VLYERDVAEYWLQKSRATHTNIAPTVSAASLADAGVVGFTDATRVDLRRVLGFRPPDEGRTYCVAPILDETQLDKVEFWAAGINCCEPLWGFYCDDVLKPRARLGVVVPGAASAHAASRYRRFLQAAEQAAALYHLQTADQPVFVRWLEDPKELQDAGLRDGIIGVVLFSVVYFIFAFVMAAWLHWSNAHRRPPVSKGP